MRKGPCQYIRKEGHVESAADMLLQRQQQLHYERPRLSRKGQFELIDKGDFRPLSRNGRIAFGWRYLSQPVSRNFYFYLPHYTLNTYQHNGITLPDMRLRWTATNEQVLEENEELARLELTLVASPPKSGAKPLRRIEHRLELALTLLNLDDEGKPLHKQELPFDTLVDVGDNQFFASLIITDINQLTSIYLALAEHQHTQAQLELRGYADMVVSRSPDILDLETLYSAKFRQNLWQRGLKVETLFNDKQLRKGSLKPFSRKRKSVQLKRSASKNAHNGAGNNDAGTSDHRLMPVPPPPQYIEERTLIIDKKLINHTLLNQQQLQLLLRKDSSRFLDIHKQKLQDQKTIEKVLQEHTLDTSGKDKQAIKDKIKQSPISINSRQAITLSQLLSRNNEKSLITTRELCAKTFINLHYPESNYGQVYESIPAAMRNDFKGLENPNLLIAFNVTVNNKREVIYQDPWQKNLFYYLPQSFKLGRAETPPYEPLLRIGFSELALESDEDDSVDINYRAEVTYTLKPHLDPSFFFAAQSDSHIQTAAEQQPIVLAPLNPATLTVDIQDDNQGTITDITSSVSQGITVTSEYDAGDFDAFFATLISDAGLPAINGLVSLPELATTQQDIPLSLSLYDTSGPMLSQYWQAADSAGQYQVVLTNPLESQLTLSEFSAQLISPAKATAKVAATSSLSIQPGNQQTLNVSVTPKDSDINDLTIDCKTQIQLDIDRLWSMLTINHGISSYAYNIDVIAEYPSLFGTSADPENLPALTALKVEFKEGPSITLDADETQVSALLYKSLLADLQDQPLNEEYHYRITNMHGDEEWARGNWIASTGTLRVAPVFPSEQNAEPLGGN